MVKLIALATSHLETPGEIRHPYQTQTGLASVKIATFEILEKIVYIDDSTSFLI